MSKSLGGAFQPNRDFDTTGQWTYTQTPTVNGSNITTASSAQTTTATTNVGTVSSNTGTVTLVERGNGLVHQTIFTLTAMPLALADAAQGGGTKIYTFPEGAITVLGAVGSVAETTTSAILTTLNGGVTYNYGLGTVTQANGTLATTEQDILSTTNGVSSTVINVAAAAAVGVRTAAPANFDGHTTAKAAFFNCGIAAAGDIDGDATTTWTGTLTVTWMFCGDV